MSTETLALILLVWTVIGFLIYVVVVIDPNCLHVKEADMSRAQLVVLRVASGPILWAYAFWLLLGKLGRRA